MVSSLFVKESKKVKEKLISPGLSVHIPVIPEHTLVILFEFMFSRFLRRCARLNVVILLPEEVFLDFRLSFKEVVLCSCTTAELTTGEDKEFIELSFVLQASQALHVTLTTLSPLTTFKHAYSSADLQLPPCVSLVPSNNSLCAWAFRRNAAV
jgi:hypothetical protein